MKYKLELVCIILLLVLVLYSLSGIDNNFNRKSISYEEKTLNCYNNGYISLMCLDYLWNNGNGEWAVWNYSSKQELGGGK